MIRTLKFKKGVVMLVDGKVIHEIFPSLFDVRREIVMPGKTAERMLPPKEGERFETLIMGNSALGSVIFRSRRDDLDLSDKPFNFRDNCLTSVDWSDEENSFRVFNEGEDPLVYLNLVVKEGHPAEKMRFLNGSIQRDFPELIGLRRLSIKPRKGFWFEHQAESSVCFIPLSGSGIICPHGEVEKRQQLVPGGGLFWGFYDSSKINIFNSGRETMEVMLLELGQIVPIVKAKANVSHSLVKALPDDPPGFWEKVEAYLSDIAATRLTQGYV